MALDVVEKKVLGALLILADENLEVKANQNQIASTMGYKRSGGAISFALKMLELKNHIEILPDKRYRVFL